MGNKITVAALVVTYNAERFIRGCLESVKWADEIIVVDMFSSDNTCKIAREYTEKIIQSKEERHEMRANMGIDRATSDWILKINATERVPQQLQAEILQTISKNTGYTGYYMPRANYFWGRFIEERPGQLYLFKRDLGEFSCIGGHETISISSGKKGYLRNLKVHWSCLTIEEAISKMNRYTLQDARSVFAGHHRAFFWKRPVAKVNLFNMLYRPSAGFFSAYIFSKGYRYGLFGFIFAVIHSFYHFLELAHLWELQYKCRHGIKDELLPSDQ